MSGSEKTIAALVRDEVDDVIRWSVFKPYGPIRIVRYRKHGVSLVVPQRVVRNTEPVGPDRLNIDIDLAFISWETVETICLKAFLIDESPGQFYEQWCDEEGYYEEAREVVRDIVWKRYYELYPHRR